MTPDGRELDREPDAPNERKGDPALGLAGAEPGFLQQLRAALGGTVKIAPSVDITAPTGERWSAAED